MSRRDKNCMKMQDKKEKMDDLACNCSCKAYPETENARKKQKNFKIRREAGRKRKKNVETRICQRLGFYLSNNEPGGESTHGMVHCPGGGRADARLHRLQLRPYPENERGYRRHDGNGCHHSGRRYDVHEDRIQDHQHRDAGGGADLLTVCGKDQRCDLPSGRLHEQHRVRAGHAQRDLRQRAYCQQGAGEPVHR